MTMLDSVSNYLSERRAGFVRSAGVAGGLYLVGQYAAARVADMRDSVLEHRGAREKYVQFGSPSPCSPIVDTAPRSMRKRFQQNRQDISFTIMTYLPLLSKHILDEMDVEALTAELQSLSRAAKAPRIPRAVGREQHLLPASHRQPSPRADSLESSAELVRASDAQSETSSASYISMSPRPEVSQLAESMSEPLPLPGHTPQSLEASSLSLESQGTSSAPSARPVEPNAPSESVISSSAVSSNDDFVVVSAHLVNVTPFLTGLLVAGGFVCFSAKYLFEEQGGALERG